jgi:hypothetical protein
MTSASTAARAVAQSSAYEASTCWSSRVLMWSLTSGPPGQSDRAVTRGQDVRTARRRSSAPRPTSSDGTRRGLRGRPPSGAPQDRDQKVRQTAPACQVQGLIGAVGGW